MPSLKGISSFLNETIQLPLTLFILFPKSFSSLTSCILLLVVCVLQPPELRMIFEEIRPAGHSLKEIAKHLNLGVLEITPVNAKSPGILSNAAMLLNRAGLSIRQAIVDDPELSPEPKLTLIVEKKIPGELIPEFLKINGVAKVSVY